MSETLDVNTVKTKIYRTILEDGLLEIMIGVYLILSGINLLNKSLILNYLWLPIALVIIEVIRRRFVYPRSGYVKISLPTIEIFKVFGAILVGIAVLIVLIALIATSVGHKVEGNWWEIISYALIFLGAISFCFIGYRFRVPRWYMHGISMGLVFLLSKAFDAHELVLGLGIWITLIGVIVFLRYLRQFPVEPSQKPNHETQSQTEEGEMAEVSNAS